LGDQKEPSGSELGEAKSINHNGTQRITQRYTKEVSRKDAKTQMKIDKGNKRLTDLRPIINRQYAELFLL